MASTDSSLICRDCKATFTLSEEERQSLATRGQFHAPSRCSDCRAARKARQAETGDRRVAPGFRELRETRTTTTCSLCHESTVVPFTVRPDRPVYCSSCFRKQRSMATEA